MTPPPWPPGEGPRIAVYAPMKPPDHPVPSGDREIARLTLRALASAGARPALVSRLVTREPAGDPAAQAAIADAAEAEADRLVAALGAARPEGWLTYHSYYKAPDLLGPRVVQALGLPYAISEPSISPSRRDGPWADFARASEAAIAAADRLFWTTERDRPALERAGHAARMVHLPAFLDPGPAVAPRPARRPLRLLTVAMMRPGDKLESYRRLGAGLARLPGAWSLEVIGAGGAEPEVRAALASLADRVVWHGAVADPARLRRAYETADLLVWPGVNEGVGMAWLEAQAAGCPVVAEAGPAARAVVTGPLAPPDDPGAFAEAILDAAADRARRSAAARASVEAHHGLDAAGARLALHLAEAAL